MKKSDCILSYKIVDWRVVFVGLLITGLLAFAAHDFALTWLSIPYPDEAAVPKWIKFSKYGLSMAAIALLCVKSELLLMKRGSIVAIMALSLVLMAFNEVLRNIIVETAISGGWRANDVLSSILKHAPKSIGYIYQATLIVCLLAVRKRLGYPLSALFLFIGTLTGFITILPKLKSFIPIAQEYLSLSQPIDRFSPPWPLYIYTYIYSTYLEPVFATFIIAMACWPRIEARINRKLGVFVGIVLFLRGYITTTLIYPVWSS